MACDARAACGGRVAPGPSQTTLRMVWILPGNKVTDGGGDKIVGRLGSATDTGPSFPGKVNYMSGATGVSDWTGVDAIDPSGASLNGGWCGDLPDQMVTAEGLAS